MKILVTGGAGYIGSHTCVELLNAGYEVIVMDNLSNSKPESLNRVRQITGKPLSFYRADILDRAALHEIFTANEIEAVIHFAGLKAVGESVSFPLSYYQNNVIGTLRLCEVMAEHNVKRMVFSSSATVYGNPISVPISEEHPAGAANPYGRTKRMIEEILVDLHTSDQEWSVALLRYFNPIGAHESGMIGEDPNGIPNNLIPYISQVAIGKLNKLEIFGKDYPTKDGTGVRDYIHVADLACGHVKALEKVMVTTGVETYNLGTGRGYSVLEMVDAFEQASGRKIPFRISGRRAGDVGISYANPLKAQRELGWSAEKGINEMCKDTWRWQSNNPQGYDSNHIHYITNAQTVVNYEESL